MSNDMLSWSQVGSPHGVGETGEDQGRIVVPQRLVFPGAPNKVRRRPNKGRIKRTDRNPPLAEPPWEMLRALNVPIPPGLECLPYTPRNWRSGGDYIRWAKQVFEMWGHTCHLCKHGEAYTADHLIPVSVWPNQPYSPYLARPAHGVRQPDKVTEGCPTCGLKCNSSRGNRQLAIEVGQYQPRIAL